MNDNPDPIIQDEINGLKVELEKARKSLPDFRKRTFNGIKENALVDCLDRAADLAEGSLKTAGTGLSASSNLLARGLLDCLFLARWILSSDENARRFELQSRNVLIRDLKQVIVSAPGPEEALPSRKGTTQTILPSIHFRNSPKKHGIKKVAKDGGLEKVYSRYYSFLLAESRGSLLDIHSAADKKWTILASLAISRAAMACVNTIISGWIISRKKTSVNDILKMFMIQPEA